MDTTPLLSWLKSGGGEEAKAKQRFDDRFPIKKLSDDEAKASFLHAFRYDAKQGLLGIVATKSFVVQVEKHPSMQLDDGLWYDDIVAVCVYVGVHASLSLVSVYADKPRTVTRGKFVDFEETTVLCVRIATEKFTVNVVPRTGWSVFELRDRLVDLVFPSR